MCPLACHASNTLTAPLPRETGTRPVTSPLFSPKSEKGLWMPKIPRRTCPYPRDTHILGLQTAGAPHFPHILRIPPISPQIPLAGRVRGIRTSWRRIGALSADAPGSPVGAHTGDGGVERAEAIFPSRNPSIRPSIPGPSSQADLGQYFIT